MQNFVNDSDELQNFSLILNGQAIPTPPQEPPTKKVKPILTIERLAEYLRNHSIDIEYDEIRKMPIYHGFDTENPEMLNANVAAILYDNLQEKYKNVTKSNIEDFMSVIMSRHTVNPVLQMIDNVHFDGNDRLLELAKILGVESDRFSCVLLQKWLCQCVALLYNNVSDPFGADGVLTLQGAQGVGKTSLFRKLAMRPEFFYEGAHINFKDKDTLIRSLSFWITELGEIETTLKSDVEALKAFLTQNCDRYRRPYGRGDVISARRTSFCGSCNSAEFLLDPSGNRRFWTIPVKEIDLEALEKLNVLQLWKQTQLLVMNNLQCFRLTAAERQELERRNSTHRKPLKAETELRDILSESDTAQFTVKMVYQTTTEFCESRPELKRYSAAAVSKALDAMGITAQSKRIDGKPPRYVRLLPKRVYR